MEVQFIPSVKRTCFFKNHYFYVESVAPTIKMEVQSQIPINKDIMVLLFFRQRARNTCLKVLCFINSPGGQFGHVTWTVYTNFSSPFL